MSPIELFLADPDGAPTLEEGLHRAALAGAATDGQVHQAHSFRAADGDPNDLVAQGWGVVVPEGAAGDRLLALADPLIARRREDQEAEVVVYRVPAHQDASAAMRWIDEVQNHPDADIADIPAYLMVLGTPAQVSLELQQALAGESYVGRVGFDDDDDVAAYVAKVLAHEDAERSRDLGRALFFSALDGTSATTLAQAELVAPTLRDASARVAQGELASTLEALEAERGQSADALLEAASAADPTVLFSMSHGSGPPRRGWPSLEHQLREQGAISLGRRQKLMGEDIASGPFLPGGMWFLFACYGAGTPTRSAYHHWLTRLREQRQYMGRVDAVLAGLPDGEQPPFSAALPQAALANPDGPLAVLGHIDLAWSYAFQDLDGTRATARHKRFQEVLRTLLAGSRAGIALHELQRTRRRVEQQLAQQVDLQQQRQLAGEDAVPPSAHRWMLRQDIDGYVLLGDPAARLPVRGSAPAQRTATTAAATVRPPLSPEEVTRREDAVHALIIGEVGVKKLAADLGVDRRTLRRWEEVYTAAGRKALAEDGD